MKNNAYVPFPSRILKVIKHTEKEYTFRMEFEGDVKPGQFFEVSMPKYGEAPISVSGIGKNFVDLTIRKVGRVTNEVFERYEGESLPVRGVVQALSEMSNANDKYLIVGFRSPDDMLFRDDLKNWDEALNLILTVDGAPEGYEGRIGLVTKYVADLPLKDVENAKAVVVGPPPMMKFTIIELKKKGFRDENITVSHERKMCCGIGKCGHCRVNEKYICLDGPVFNYAEARDMID